MTKTITTGLPKNTKSVHIEVKGETTGQMWKGEFEIVRMPTIGMITQADVIQARLNSDLTTISPTIKAIHNMLAQCQTRILAAPQWWYDHNEGQDLIDMNVLAEVYKHLAGAEMEYREEVWGPEAVEKAKEERKEKSKSEKEEGK